MCNVLGLDQHYFPQLHVLHASAITSINENYENRVFANYHGLSSSSSEQPGPDLKAVMQQSCVFTSGTMFSK